MAMTRICILAAALLALVGVSLSGAGAKYEVTLDSGDTYTVERVASDTFNVTDGADEPVGYLKTGGGGIQVFSARFDPQTLAPANRLLRGIDVSLER